MHVLEKRKRSIINKLSFHIQQLEKKIEFKSQAGRKKRGKKTKREINEIKNRKTKRKLMKSKAGSQNSKYQNSIVFLSI